jgi:hypothetical protein
MFVATFAATGCAEGEGTILGSATAKRVDARIVDGWSEEIPSTAIQLDGLVSVGAADDGTRRPVEFFVQDADFALELVLCGDLEEHDVGFAHPSLTSDEFAHCRDFPRAQMKYTEDGSPPWESLGGLQISYDDDTSQLTLWAQLHPSADEWEPLRHLVVEAELEGRLDD